MNVAWESVHEFQSKFGSLFFNVTDPVTLRRWQVMPDGYKFVPTLRVTQENISQRDGSVLHPRFTTGMVATMTIRPQLMKSATGADYTDACDADLTSMVDDLTRWTNGIRNLVYADSQRLRFSPPGSTTDRMLLAIELLAWPDPSIADTQNEFTFAVESPYPYAVDFTQNDTVIPDATGTLLVNDGSADTYPVIWANGPFTNLTITNSTSGLLREYDGTRPGAVAIAGGDYIEIDMFRGTAFLNGNGPDRIQGVVPTTTDFFPITCNPAGDVITPNGAGIEVFWNRAWA